MNAAALKVTYLTAGAGGMYCGSCMQDNTLARALQRLGVDIQLVPTYAPIRTDEENVSLNRVFLGGIHVYLAQQRSLVGRLPWLDRLLDHPWLIRWAASRQVQLRPEQLGAMTVSMLRGSEGRQRREVEKLCRWLSREARPHLVHLSNMLIGGCVPSLKQSLGVPLLVTLQGDDIFLEGLPEPFRTQALNRIRELVAHVDGFIVFSRYYEDFMGRYFGIPPEKLHRVRLGIDTQRFGSTTAAAGSGGGHRPPRPATIGYVARLAPEKGLHLLVEAFIQLRDRPGFGAARLHIAGWLGGEHQRYAEAQFARLREAGLAGAYRFEGAIDGQRKATFLQELDVLSVPTTYREPKGLYVLEALASGVPVVQPEHGVFPEMLAATGGGWLVPPEDPAALAAVLERLLRDEPLRRRLGAEGQRAVRTRFDADAMGRAMLGIYRQFVKTVAGGP